VQTKFSHQSCSIKYCRFASPSQKRWKQTIKQRHSIRDISNTNSDIRQRQFKQRCARFESLHELPDELHIRIDTDLPPAESLRQTLAHDYALLSQQTAAAIKHWESG
jgi:hypothetical protein